MEHNRVIYSKAYDSEVEYLRSNGSYIDSGIYANQNTKIEMRFCANSFSTASGGIIGVHTTVSGHKSFAVLLSRIGTSGNYTGGISYDSFNVKGGSTGISLNELGVYHTLIYRNGLLRLDNEEVYIDFPNQETLDTMFIMRANGSSFSSQISVSYCKIWNQDTLVRDFIPVRVGNIGYMYDKVSGKLFGNKGTGNFILGQDVANPVPNIRRVFRFGNKRFVMPMPYDSRVEYLESTGTQYINTNLLPSVNYQYHIIYEVVTLGNNILFGERGSGTYDSSRNQIYFTSLSTNQNKKTFLRNLYNVNDFDLSITPKVNVLVNTPLMRCNNTSFTGLIRPLFVFCLNDKGTPTAFSKIKIFNFSIIDNNSTILDLIPVRKNGIGYMYDKVSGKLFSNSGTGQFILGNDIND